MFPSRRKFVKIWLISTCYLFPRAMCERAAPERTRPIFFMIPRGVVMNIQLNFKFYHIVLGRVSNVVCLSGVAVV